MEFELEKKKGFRPIEKLRKKQVEFKKKTKKMKLLTYVASC
jgi:hypothetical protein